MKNWSDPGQKPVVRPLMFQEVGAPPRAMSSVFFEGRSPDSYMAHSPVAARLPTGESQDFSALDDDGNPGQVGENHEDWSSDFSSFEAPSAFDPIIPSAVFAPAPPPAAAREPEDDPRVIAALAALDESLRALLAARHAVLSASEADVIRIAVALAERVVGSEIRQRPEVLLNAARQGIAVLSETDRYIVRISPGPSEAHLNAFRSALVAKHGRSELIVDDRLAPFSCVVESAQGRVDESVSARMAAVLEQAGLGKVLSDS